MAVVVVNAPGRWVSTSPTALGKKTAVVHVARSLLPYRGRYVRDDNGNVNLLAEGYPGEMYVTTACGAGFDAVQHTWQNRAPCKLCARVKPENLPVTVEVTIAPTVRELDDRLRAMWVTVNGADVVPESPGGIGQGTLIE